MPMLGKRKVLGRILVFPSCREWICFAQVTVEEVEESLAQFGETSSSDKDIVTPSNAELVCMAFGKSVIFSQAVLVKPSPPPPFPSLPHTHVGRSSTSLS